MTVCVPCGAKYKVEENGYVVEEVLDDGRPYKLRIGDKWKCPSCGHEVVVGFPTQPLTEHYMHNYGELKSQWPPSLTVK